MSAEAWAYVFLAGLALLFLVAGGLWADRWDAAHRDARRRNR